MKRLSRAKVTTIWRQAIASLKGRHDGGAIAIDLRTGRWVAGRDSRAAILRALRRDPKAEFEVLRIGHRPAFQMKRLGVC